MKVHIQKTVSLILAVALSLSLVVVPSYAAESPDEYNQGLSNFLFETFGIKVQDIVSELTMPFVGPRTYSELMECLRYYNDSFASAVGQALREGLISAAAKASFSDGKRATIQYDKDRNIYRIRDEFTQKWYVGYSGLYPYCTKDEYENAWENQPATEISTGEKTANQWVDMRALSTRDLQFFSKETLSNAAYRLNERGVQCSLITTTFNVVGTPTKCYVIGTPGAWPKLYCNSSGMPFVAKVEPEKSAAENTYNYNTVVKVEDNSTNIDQITLDNSIKQEDTQIIDLTNSVLNLITDNGDKVSYNIDSVIWNEDNSSYTVNAYDIKQTNNYYEYNYYTYNIQYTYNNTYVTYIGSTAEYQPKEWALYYELPDGRSSADLTEEDIAGLSFQFNDVVNYKRGTTDTSLRALYHFDGNTNDSSYFSTDGKFEWNTGASITYMESNAFNGALYLDEKAHDFTITLPSNIGSGDFSLQWRYYQNSATTSTNMDNYLTIGGQKLLQWSEHALYNGSGTKVGDLSVGTWQELALVRNKGTLYIYHNGVKLASIGLSSVLTGEIKFHLGPNSKAYAMLDEMRIVDFAIAEAGAKYTPTAVPYDTNSVLVLPEGEGKPDEYYLVDAYWEFDHTITPVLSYDFSNKLYGITLPSSSSNSDYYYFEPNNSSSNGYWVGDNFFTSDFNSLEIKSDSVRFSSLQPSGSVYYYLASATDSYNSKGLVRQVRKSDGFTSFPFLPLFRYVWFEDNRVGRLPPNLASLNEIKDGTLLNGTYTMSVAFSDGTKASSTFTYDLGTSNSHVSIPLNSSTNKLQVYLDMCYQGTNGTSSTLGCCRWLQYLSFLGDCEVVYMEIVPGSVSNNHEWVEVYDTIYGEKGLPSNTAAVQTDIPIHGYTVGGVRPTFPERGDVWFPVEGSRISGVYIYNGQAWEQTNARWWTGKRWIPIYAFDLVTLQDCWDVTSSDGPGTEVTPPISSEYSFWNWWKSAWNSFTGQLFGVLGPGSGGGSGTDPGGGTDIPDDMFEPEAPGEEDDGWNVFDLLIALKDGTWAVVKGTVKTAFGGVKGIVGAVTDIGSFFFAVGGLEDTIKGWS